MVSVVSVLLMLQAGAGPLPSPTLFASHREKLLSRMPPDAVAVFRAARVPDAEVDEPYRQDSDFWYLTGFPEPEAIAVLRTAGPGPRYVLFVQPKDFGQEQWTGLRAGVEGARTLHGADEAYPVGELWQRLPELLRGARSLYYRDGRDRGFRDALFEAWDREDENATSPRPKLDARPIVQQLRLIKDDEELRLLRHAVALSVEAHRAAMRRVRPGAHEYALKAAMVEACLSGGATRMAYPPIVGSGPNSVILHYERAGRRINAGEMIVNDSACEYAMYAADVTRSYPASGRFTPEQRLVYDIVLQAQKAGFAKVRPGTPIHEVYDATVSAIVDGLLRLGMLTGSRDEIVKKRTYTKFYPHGSSHWLGLNVHDAGSYERAHMHDRFDRYASAQAKLEPGMVLTVEPGIYIPEGAVSDPRFANVGIRIEDDVLVTPTGMECLSCALPREAAEVEKAILGR